MGEFTFWVKRHEQNKTDKVRQCSHWLSSSKIFNPTLTGLLRGGGGGLINDPNTGIGLKINLILTATSSFDVYDYIFVLDISMHYHNIQTLIYRIQNLQINVSISPWDNTQLPECVSISMQKTKNDRWLFITRHIHTTIRHSAFGSNVIMFWYKPDVKYSWFTCKKIFYLQMYYLSS